MKTRWLWLALILLLLVAFQAGAQNTANRPAMQDAQNVFTGTTDTFVFNGALSDPIPPTVTLLSTTGGTCSSLRTFRIYTSYVNASGETALSPPSIEFKPATSTTNVLTVVRPALDPSISQKINTWRAWYTSSLDGHVTIRACGAAGAIVDTPIATTTTTCLCSTSTDAQEPTSNTTSNVTVASFGHGPPSISSTFGGPTTFSSTATFSGTTTFTGSVSISNVAATPQTVHICGSGCEYTTLKSACAAETSTCAAPLVYYVHAGAYSTSGTGTTAEQNCGGEACALIIGDGPATRIINTSTDSGNYGAVSIGNSTDITVANMYIKGHRAIWGSGAGGTITFRNLILEADSAQPDNDCAFLDALQANTVRVEEDNLCIPDVDGFTNGSFTAPMFWYATGNRVIQRQAEAQSGSGFAFGGIPDLFVSTGNVIDSKSADSTGVAQWYGYRFNGDQSGCSSGCRAEIVGGDINIANQDGVGDGGVAYGVFIHANATELATMNITGTSMNISTTDTGGLVAGVRLENATSVVNVTGVRVRASGGSQNYGFSDGSAAYGHVNVMTSDYTAEQAGTIAITDGQVGSFKTTLLGRVGDLVAATCTNNEIALDTGGANKEICICDGGAWACSTVTTATGPTN